jgi:hypothetical protein
LIELKDSPAYWEVPMPGCAVTPDVNGNVSGWSRNPDAADPVGGPYTRGVFNDVVPGQNQPGKWFEQGKVTFTYLKGYAHCGDISIPQTSRDKRIEAIQIWGWHDTNGDGLANVADANTAEGVPKCEQWTLLHEIKPATVSGHAVGGNIPWTTGIHEWPNDAGELGDLLQCDITGTDPLTFQPRESWLLLLRVVDVNGNTNLMNGVAGATEVWYNGDSGDPVGSLSDDDKYIGYNGLYSDGPKLGEWAVADDVVVWIYCPK